MSKILIVTAHPDETLIGWETQRYVLTRYDTPEKRKKHAEEQKRRREADPERDRAIRRKSYQVHKEKYQKIARERRQMYRLKCITHYSNGKMKCICCDENEYFFLAIDHINNDGAEHRKTVSSGQLYSWLVSHGFPKGFQVLCHNCNTVKGHYGKCVVHGGDAI